MINKSEDNFHNIIEKSADAIVIVSRKGVILFVNPSAELLFARKGGHKMAKHRWSRTEDSYLLFHQPACKAVQSLGFKVKGVDGSTIEERAKDSGC